MKKMLTQITSLNYSELLQHQLTTLHFKHDAVNITGFTASTQEWLQQDYSALHLGTTCEKFLQEVLGES